MMASELVLVSHSVAYVIRNAVLRADCGFPISFRLGARCLLDGTDERTSQQVAARRSQSPSEEVPPREGAVRQIHDRVQNTRQCSPVLL